MCDIFVVTNTVRNETATSHTAARKEKNIVAFTFHNLFVSYA